MGQNQKAEISPHKCSQPVVQLVMDVPEVQETWVLSLVQEDSPEKEIAKPLQFSCLENPMDRGTWWDTVHGVTRIEHNLAIKPPPPILDKGAKNTQQGQDCLFNM